MKTTTGVIATSVAQGLRLMCPESEAVDQLEELAGMLNDAVYSLEYEADQLGAKEEAWRTRQYADVLSVLALELQAMATPSEGDVDYAYRKAHGFTK